MVSGWTFDIKRHLAVVQRVVIGFLQVSMYRSNANHYKSGWKKVAKYTVEAVLEVKPDYVGFSLKNGLSNSDYYWASCFKEYFSIQSLKTWRSWHGSKAAHSEQVVIKPKDRVKGLLDEEYKKIEQISLHWKSCPIYWLFYR